MFQQVQARSTATQDSQDGVCVSLPLCIHAFVGARACVSDFLNLSRCVCACVCAQRTAAQVGGEDVLGGDEQLLAEVGGFRGTVGQQLQHALHHLLGVLPHKVLVEQAHTHTITYTHTGR